MISDIEHSFEIHSNIHSKFNENSLERRKRRENCIILQRIKKGARETKRGAPLHLYSAIIITLSRTLRSARHRSRFSLAQIAGPAKLLLSTASSTNLLVIKWERERVWFFFLFSFFFSLSSFFLSIRVNKLAAGSLSLSCCEVCFAIDSVSFRDRAFNRACIFEVPIGT